MRIGSPSAVFHPATDHVVFGNLSFNLSLSLSALVSSSVKLRHCCLVLSFLFWNFLESFKKVSTGLEKKQQPKTTKSPNQTHKQNPTNQPHKTPLFAMYLQSGWGNWKLPVSFLHQHKQFTKLTHTTTFPATQISENSGKISDIFWSFLEVQAVSNMQWDTQHQPEHSAVQITSLWARTPVDQDYDHSSPTAQDQQLIMLDFFSLLELPKKESSCFLLNHFPHKTVLQNFSPPLKFPFLFQLQKTGTCLLNHLHNSLWFAQL